MVHLTVLVQNAKNILITRDYKPSKVKNQFFDIRNISTDEARRPKTKSNFSTSCNSIIQYNPALLNIKTILKKYLPLIYNNQECSRFFQINLEIL